MISDMGHCGGDNAPTVTDMLSVIDQGVEKGQASDSIIANRSPIQKAMTRPICPYLQIAKYKGSGSTDDAANFEFRAK